MLKPCPFCGKGLDENDQDVLYPTGTCWEDVTADLRRYVPLRRVAGEYPHGQVFGIHCNTHMGGCGASINADSVEEVVIRWNTRTPPSGETYNMRKHVSIAPLTEIDQVQVGDVLLLYDGNETLEVRAQRVKVSKQDGTEVIFNLQENKFFNVGMFLEGKSWVREAWVLHLSNNLTSSSHIADASE